MTLFILDNSFIRLFSKSQSFLTNANGHIKHCGIFFKKKDTLLTLDNSLQVNRCVTIQTIGNKPKQKKEKKNEWQLWQPCQIEISQCTNYDGQLSDER